MIQLEAIRVFEFRGIRDLELEIGSSSYVIWGPNGSGKSGIVDAIDFALTGNIARLKGSGSGGLTVLKHGPHVHKRDDPAASRVELTLRDTASGKTAVLSRSVKNPKQFSIVPDSPEVRSAVERTQQHPELTLSRREVIKYIVCEPESREKEVQALLRLDRLGEQRALLLSARSKIVAAEKADQKFHDDADEAFLRHLDTSTMLTTEVLLKVNQRRVQLGLAPLAELSLESQLTVGMDVVRSTEPTFNKLTAAKDVGVLTDSLEVQSPDLTQATSRYREALNQLEADPSILASVALHAFVESGLTLVAGDECPLCDLGWPTELELRTHLLEKLERSSSALALRGQLLGSAQALGLELRRIGQMVDGAANYLDSKNLEQVDRLRNWATELRTFAVAISTLEGSLGHRERIQGDIFGSAEFHSDLVDLKKAIDARPDQSALSAAESWLVIAQERWEKRRQTQAKLAKSKATAVTGGAVYKHYCAASDEALTSLYSDVEKEFSEFYREINSDDESAFKASLEPSAGKLDLSVDFYGLGMFPPGAYHSEGHQDGMGVCLYLSLVKQLLGSDFRFAVLDDVVMSIDSNHRRQFCNLLKNRFPDVQFIITTHDEVWARQMKSSGLVSKASQAHFHGWTVDGGPVLDSGSDFWDKVEEHLSNADVPAAAACLRRSLESTMTDLASSLRGSVPYRQESNHDLGELLSSVKGAHSKWLKAASNSANSWNNEANKA